MSARGLPFPDDRSPAEAKAKVTKPPKAADGVKKPRGRPPKARAEATVNEEGQNGEEGEEVLVVEEQHQELHEELAEDSA